MTKQGLQSNHNAVYSLCLHLVLVTKYRRKVLTPRVLQRCCEILSTTCKRWDATCIESNGEVDHVHALISVPPKVRPSDLVNNLKTVTSRRLRSEFTGVREAYKKPTLWSPSYCLISAGGAPLDVLKSYIEDQGKNRP